MLNICSAIDAGRGALLVWRPFRARIGSLLKPSGNVELGNARLTGGVMREKRVPNALGIAAPINRPQDQCPASD
jgi:hypothetical protein